MITKDRYSFAFAFVLSCLVIAFWLLRNNKEMFASISLGLGVIPFIYLFNKPARIHITGDQVNKLKPEFKGENDCGFTSEYKQEVDGMRLNGVRYKFVNGTDVYINDHNIIKSCGFGSSIIQLAGGGKEPKSILKDNCWN
jgi:hypothetical protein